MRLAITAITAGIVLGLAACAVYAGVAVALSGFVL